MYKLYQAGVTGNMWHIINDFLMNRKVQLLFNNHTGMIRATLAYGLPQGSCLSPTLFKFFIADLGSDIKLKGHVDIFKFADDGTVLVTGETTGECLKNLEDVCTALKNWCNRWRMVINCNPGKTEVICFGTAENDLDLVPEFIFLGQDKIMFVESTTVLGLTIDSKLSYIEHGKQIYKKILVRWVKICKYTNRNWGFNQHVIVRLLEVLVSTCVQYAGLIWINKRSLEQIEKVWYKMLKAAVGAVFNVKQSIAEVILGIPPILVTTQVNEIKHMLKLNIVKHVNDPLSQLVLTELQNSKYNPTITSIKEVWKYLDWKRANYPNCFTQEDHIILENKAYDQFLNLSTTSCEYTKKQIKQFTELTWQNKLNSQFSMDGYSVAPTASCTKLKIRTSNRNVETLVMSTFYENNLFNSFINKATKGKHGSPFCPCNKIAIQDAMHVITECEWVDKSKRDRLKLQIDELGEMVAENSIAILKLSRNKLFMDTLTAIMKESEYFLRREIQL